MNRRNMLSLAALSPFTIKFALANETPNNRNRHRSILVEAHRGNSAFAPENTLPAIEQAVKLGVDRVEIDLECSVDGLPVVIHDNTVDRTTNGSGKVSLMTYAAIKKLDAGSWKAPEYTGSHVPLLQEVFEICKNRSMVNIDLKNLEAIPGMISAIRDMNMEDQVVVTGKVPDCVYAVRESGLYLTMFYENSPRFGELLNKKSYDMAMEAAVSEARLFQLPGFLFHRHWITPEHIYMAKRHGLAVNVYDVNTPETLQEMIAAEVDGVMTDDPAMVLRIVNSISKPV